jgi:plasmid replication initiation protein
MEKQLVIKSNFLVEASYRLSAIEQKVVLTLATKIKKTDREFKQYLFNLRDLAHFLGLETNADYDYLRKITHNLLSKVLTLQKEDSTLQTHWLESVEYFDNKSTVGLRFNPDLKPFLIHLKNNFTKYHLKYAIQLKSRFSIRLYELLKQYENVGSRLFQLEELRDRLGIRSEEYPLYGNFKAKVLKVAQKELKEKTDLSFKFEEIKSGRKVTNLKFIITSKKIPDQSEDLEIPSLDFEQGNLFPLDSADSQDDEAIQALVAILPKEYQGKKSIEKLLSENLQKHGYDYVVRNIEYANDNSNATNPGANITRGSNYRNYLAKALKGDFGLAYQEDTAAEKLQQQQVKAAAAEQERQKRLEQEKIDRERELTGQARKILETMSQEELKEIELAAISKLSPEMKKMAIENRFTAQIAINRAMEKVIIERYFKNDSISQIEGKSNSGEA